MEIFRSGARGWGSCDKEEAEWRGSRAPVARAAGLERSNFGWRSGTGNKTFVDKEEEFWRGGQEPVSGAVCLRKSRMGERDQGPIAVAV